MERGRQMLFQYFTKKLFSKMKKRGFFLVALSPLLIFSSLTQVTEAKGAEITLLHTKSVTGHLLACPT